MAYYEWKPYVPVAARRAKALREMEKLRKKGQPVSPVVLEGRTIARTFWGKAWCENLERYSDYSNRLPRGRAYVRNGSVVDLQIGPGEVNARVSGSEIYTVTIGVAPVPKAKWSAICADCAGAIDSLVELLQGRFSKGVMERICRQGEGLFPAPSEIKLACSCPDWASMCKHVAAVLYGIGARLDEQPELLFRLRQVEGGDLIAQAGAGLPLPPRGPAKAKVVERDDLSELFGLDLAEPAPAPGAGKAIAAAKAARGPARPDPPKPGKAVPSKPGAKAGKAGAPEPALKAKGRTTKPPVPAGKGKAAIPPTPPPTTAAKAKAKAPAKAGIGKKSASAVKSAKPVRKGTPSQPKSAEAGQPAGEGAASAAPRRTPAAKAAPRSGTIK